MSSLPLYTSSWPNLYFSLLLSINILPEICTKADRKDFNVFLLVLLQSGYY